jgi:hypothetical protein
MSENIVVKSTKQKMQALLNALKENSLTILGTMWVGDNNVLIRVNQSGAVPVAKKMGYDVVNSWVD